jgi:hypothetical protein
MLHQRKPVTVASLIAGIILALSITSVAGIKKHVKGTIKDNVYTSPEKDFRIRIPLLIDESVGGAARDKTDKTPEFVASQVVFTNDFGKFYRVISLNPKGEPNIDNVLQTFSGIQDKQTVQTSRGREWRVIDLAIKGSAITETEFTPSGNTTRVLDLLTANAVFTANGRIYVITAGDVSFRKPDAKELDEVRKELDDFLAGFEAINAGTPDK